MLKIFDEKVKNVGGTARLMRGYGLSEVTICVLAVLSRFTVVRELIFTEFANTTPEITFVQSTGTLQQEWDILL